MTIVHAICRLLILPLTFVVVKQPDHILLAATILSAAYLAPAIVMIVIMNILHVAKVADVLLVTTTHIITNTTTIIIATIAEKILKMIIEFILIMILTIGAYLKTKTKSSRII